MSLFDSIKKAFHTTEVQPPPPQAAPAQPGSVSSEERALPPSAANRVIDRRILFVGGDPRWFQLVERDVLTIQPNWQCQHVKDSAGVRSLLAAAVTFDALVLDGQLRDGAKLLAQLEQKREAIICLVRGNISDKAVLEHWKRTSATLVSEDSNAAFLVSTIKRSERLRDWMADPAIKKLLPQIHKLPTAPEIHAQVTEHLESPNGSMITVARLVSQDPVMSAKILQVVNSVQFGLAHEVTDTADAVIILGVERIKALILLAGVFSQYSDTDCPGFSPEPIWAHSVQVGMLARTIAFAETKTPEEAESAFTAGLLHDVGKLILAANLPEMHQAVRQLQTSQKLSLREADMRVMGVTHAEFGACLLGTWGLPLPVLEAIAWHHEPQRSTDQGFSLLAAVHVANVFAHETAGGGGEGAPEQINVEFLLQSGLGDCRNRWREFCGLPAKAEP